MEQKKLLIHFSHATISHSQQSIFISRNLVASVFSSINVFPLSMGDLKSHMTVFHSRSVNYISHIVITR